MDFNSIDPLNTDPQPASPPPPADPTGFEHQLSELQDSPPPYAAWSPVSQGRAYSPYLEAEHPYSSHLNWDNDLHTPAAVPPGPLPAAGESLLRPSSQQTIAQSLAEAADFDQDLIWQDVEPGPMQAEPSSAAGERFLQPSSQQPPAQSLAEAFDKDPVWEKLEPRLLQAGPSHAAPSQAGPSSSTGGAPLELGNFVMENGRRAGESWAFFPQTASNAQLNMLRTVGLMPSKDSPTTFSMLGVPHTAEWQEDFVRLNPSYSGEDSPTG